jgi:DHA1 family multidrug resistance protein-like MFS transporter
VEKGWLILKQVTIFWFAWTGQYNSIHWIVPTLAGVFLSTSILLVFVAFLNYLTDTYLMYAASALAANTVCRSACAAAAPLFTQDMFDALGVGGGGSLIAGVACLLAPIPFVFYRYGEPIRRRSKFAPTEEEGVVGRNAEGESTGADPSTVEEEGVDGKGKEGT